MAVPSLLLKQLYTFGSLKNSNGGISFSLKNCLQNALLTEIIRVKLNDEEIPLSKIVLDFGNGMLRRPDEITQKSPVDFPLKTSFTLMAHTNPLRTGKHKIEVRFRAKPFGKLTLKVESAMAEPLGARHKIPRDPEDDYGDEAVTARQGFVEKYSGLSLNHIKNYSFDPRSLKGNIEHFTGVAQVPLGIAGPLTINGEHAKGDFIVPMATTEGTLVASYNRGMKVLNASGGTKCTIMEDAMQRAPVFVFEDARGARDFVKWIRENQAEIASKAEATTSVGKLLYINDFLANKFAYLRFNFYTGDAAGQNMVGRATFAACSWILDQYKENKIHHFYLESNLATDKKASQVNVMHTRGKRVTAEAVLKRDVLIQNMRVEPESLSYHSQVANVGTILSGANNNGAHSANAITAIFIATGQDVANVSESSAGIMYTELTKEGDLYVSITIPSLIVATYGGGVGLATQRECLELMGCFGKGKVRKFAEIVAGTVLAGEISLAAAISSSDWVSSHEQYGRNR